MRDLMVSPGGVVIPRIKVIEIKGPWHLTRAGAEVVWGDLERWEKQFLDKYFKLDSLKDRIRMMSGSDGNYLSKKWTGVIDGATAFTAPATRYFALYTSALDDTFTGATTGEAAYTSYARLALTNNTTIFAAGSGTTTFTNTYPSDATKSFVTSTGSTSTVTYLGDLDGNAGTSGDHGLKWCSVTSTVINSGDTPQLTQNGISQTRD